MVLKWPIVAFVLILLLLFFLVSYVRVDQSVFYQSDSHRHRNNIFIASSGSGERSPVAVDCPPSVTQPTPSNSSTCKDQNENYRQPLVAVCTVFKNESPFLLEWIAYHYRMGVRKFFLFDDRSADDFEDFLDELIESGLVELYQVPKRAKLQFQAFDRVTPHQGWAFSRCVDFYATERRVDWLLFIDVDEFVYVQGPNDPVPYPANQMNDSSRSQNGGSDGNGGASSLLNRLTDFLSERPFCDQTLIGGLDMPSLPFGSNGRIENPEGPATANYVRRFDSSVEPFSDVKCLLRVGHQKALTNHVCNTWPVSGSPANPLKPSVVGTFPWQRGPPTENPLAVFHYRSRSLSDCAYKALAAPSEDYKQWMAVSNCGALFDVNSMFHNRYDWRLAVHVTEIMRTARCLHPRRWRCRFSEQFPELAARSLGDLCDYELYGRPVKQEELWRVRDQFSGNWLAWETHHEEQLDRAAQAAVDAAIAQGHVADSKPVHGQCDHSSRNYSHFDNPVFILPEQFNFPNPSDAEFFGTVRHNTTSRWKVFRALIKFIIDRAAAKHL